MNNVLMVTFHWPPDRTSGVWRPLRFAKYLPQSGWLPTVVTRGCILTCRVDCENKNRVSGDVQRVRPIGDEDLTWILSWVLMPVLRVFEKSRQWLVEGISWRTKRLFQFPDKGTAYNRRVLSTCSRDNAAGSRSGGSVNNFSLRYR